VIDHAEVLNGLLSLGRLYLKSTWVYSSLSERILVKRSEIMLSLRVVNHSVRLVSLTTILIAGISLQASAILPLPLPSGFCPNCQAIQLPDIDGIEGVGLSFNFGGMGNFDLPFSFFGKGPLSGTDIAPGTSIPFSYRLDAMAFAFFGVNSLGATANLGASDSMISDTHSTSTETNCGFLGNQERCITVVGDGVLTFPQGVHSGDTMILFANFRALTFPSIGEIDSFSGTLKLSCPCFVTPEPHHPLLVLFGAGMVFTAWCRLRKRFQAG
jgi:hypothetical protein